MKYLMFICCLFFASNSIAETPQNLIDFVNKYKVGRYHPQFEIGDELVDDIASVNGLIDQVTDEINSGSTDPRIYWLRPLLQDIILVMNRTHHKDIFVKLYGTNDNYGPATIKKIKQAALDYEKALLLNKTASAEEKLNEDMISAIYVKRSLPAHVLEMASRENMTFMEKTGHFENEREVYQQFYFDMINSYIRDKDYDNALRILKEFDGVQGGVLEENLPILDAHKDKWEKEAIQDQ